MIYKKASKLRLRVETARGSLSVEHLWSLPVTEISELIKTAYSKIEKEIPDELGFLAGEKSRVSETDDLTFKILKDIYVTKTEEMEASIKAFELKKKRDLIAGLIEEKKEEGFRSKTVEELQAMLDEMK